MSSSKLLTAVTYGGCRKAAPEAEITRPVRAIKVDDVQAFQGRDFPGRAKAREELELSFRVSGPLVSLPVDVGSEVKKGDVVAALDPRDFQTALDSTQANLTLTLHMRRSSSTRNRFPASSSCWAMLTPG